MKKNKILGIGVVVLMIMIGLLTVIYVRGALPPPDEIEGPRMVFHLNASYDKDIYIDNTIGSNVRIYGDDGAIYPTQSYTGSSDFIYPGYMDPFDPGIIAKDSVTFNPAYIDLEYTEIDRRHNRPFYEQYCVNRTLRVDGADSSEKVFLRLFYEPWYWHPIDSLMDQYTLGMLREFYAFNAIVVETTYMLTNHQRDPICRYSVEERDSISFSIA